MSGLPGVGKDFWIRRQFPPLPVVSLDEIRRQRPEVADNQGAIVAAAKEYARSLLRRHEPFVWNATNTTRNVRAPLIQLLAGYRARIRLIYLETGWTELLKRNRSREFSVPEHVIHRIANHLEIPDLMEAHCTEHHVS